MPILSKIRISPDRMEKPFLYFAQKDSTMNPEGENLMFGKVKLGSQIAIVFIVMLALSSFAFADNGLGVCSELGMPFSELSQMVTSSDLPNPPQVQLCHRLANVFKHNDDDRLEKAISELEKFIAEVEKSVPKHLNNGQAQELIDESNRVIKILMGDYEVLCIISGGVFYFNDNSTAANAKVTLIFPETGNSYTTDADSAGLFSFENLEPQGAFVISAGDGANATGNVQGSLKEGVPEVSVVVLIEQPGTKNIQGNIADAAGLGAPGVIVTVVFPKTKRTYNAITSADGSYSLKQIHPDGTFIMVAFESQTGASVSYSSFISSYYASRTINLQLEPLPTVNPELTNAGFTDGFNGWNVKGPAQIIDRNLVFDLD